MDRSTYFSILGIGLMAMLSGWLGQVNVQPKTEDVMKKGTIIYVFDPLCGWCYGFSPSMEAFSKKFATDYNIEVISGGMVTGDHVGPIGEIAPYIKSAYKDVERATGITFGKAFLENILEEGSTIFSSVPPSVALAVFKEYEPDQALAFASAIQKAIYFDGIDPNEAASYGELATAFGIDRTEFIQRMADPDYLKKAQSGFVRSNQLGVTGFPTVFIQEENGSLNVLSRGYLPLETLERKMDQLKR